MPAIDLLDLARGEAASDVMNEARRAMEVCNACRYCEGYCAVFPAMELRRDFSDGDLSYLANLCHGCHGCYYACQYAPPHPFGINVPRVFAELRHESYAKYAWPAPLARLYDRNGMVMAAAMSGGVALILVLALLRQNGGILFGPQPLLPGRGFYDVIPYGVMTGVASISFLFALLALAIGFSRFWSDTGGQLIELRRWAPVKRALHDAATLRYLGGGGHGCNDTDGTFSTRRRRSHHVMAYGFLACFASTSVATMYHHLFGWPAPYPFFSIPVVLGTVGGIGLSAGSAALLWLKLAGDRDPRSTKLLGAETGLLVLLMMTALSGLLLLAVRATGAMGVTLAVHLGFILALFLTMPYSKFVHGLYRFAALIRHAIERPDTANSTEKV